MNVLKRNSKIVIPVVIVGVLIALPIFWWLASPLWRTETVDEAFPFDLPTAAEAENMSPSEIETALTDAMDEIGDGEMLEKMPETEVVAAEARIMELSAEMPDKEMEDEMPEAADEWLLVSSGEFRDADRAHQGSGNASIFQQGDQRVLRFEDFEVTNGPDLHVLLVENINGTGRGEIGNYVDLGQLKGNVGAQNYEIPADVDLSQYEGVLIYCMPFHVVFSTALLN